MTLKPYFPLSLVSVLLIIASVAVSGKDSATAAVVSDLRRSSSVTGLCAQIIDPAGYPCSEHSTQTEDGYLLGLQRVSSSATMLKVDKGPPVLLLHGLFMAGDAWFINSPSESLGFILADSGFDVWVGNVRGTHWSYGHTTLSVKDKEFWDWSWEDLAMYDLAEMLRYVYNITNSKVFIVGHSQGTIMSLAAFTEPNIVNMVEAAALLCPISYLDHITSAFVLRIVHLHLDEMITLLGIHQLNFKSDVTTSIADRVCDGGHVDCSDLLSSITGANCCFNSSRIDFYLDYEPHPSSSKNLNHLFQMIRKGTFAKYDYGILKNLKEYKQTKPPSYDLSKIPESLPLWMGYGGNDALADVIDVERTVKELKSKPKMVFIDDYGHIDFLLSVRAKTDLYDDMVEFFQSFGGKFSGSERLR